MHRFAAASAIALVIVIGLAPTGESASSIRASAATHSSPLSVPPLAASSRPQREVFGFVNAANLGDPSAGYPSWDLSLLTTVAFFGLHVNSGDGHPVTINDTAWNVYHSATMTNFVNAAHANGVRVIASINLHDFSTASNNQVCYGLLTSNYRSTIDWVVREVNWAHIDGVNVNYEGTITSCDPDALAPQNTTNRDRLTAFVKELRAAMPGKYLAIDTFVGSAEDNLEFFDITGLAPYVDGFFVMAYDSDYENSFNPPLSCSSYCFNPVSPLNTYRFNVTTSMAQYTALVPASKVILGQPYYGRAGCVASANVAHQVPIRNFSTSTYRWASRLTDHPEVSNAMRHRDPSDGVSEWDTWWDADWQCTAEQYYDDVWSLSAKYDLVNRKNLGGVGIFTLDYGGGLPELWAALATYFSCPVTINLPATQSTTQFSAGLSAGSCSVAYYEVEQFDMTLGQGWFSLGAVGPSGGSAAAIIEGFQGHTYQVRARTHSTGGAVSSWANATTAVSAAAPLSHPFKGLYTLDGWGGVHFDNSPPLAGFAYWPGWRIARAVHALPGATSPQSGAVLEGYGGLHTYGAPINIGITASWPGWDIARDFAFLPDGTGGFVLDGFGGLHPFRINGSTAPLSAQLTAAWPGWDIARKVVIFPDGTGGYVMDGWGGLHPFGINQAPPVSSVATTGYWPGWSIARDIQLVPGNSNHSGYVMDGWGGMHPFHPTTDGSTMPASIIAASWPGWDIARSLWFLPGSATAGYTLDGYGGVHPFGGAPTITNYATWAGWDIAAFIWGG